MEFSACCTNTCDSIAVAKGTSFGYGSGAGRYSYCDPVHYVPGLRDSATQQSRTYLSHACCNARLLLGRRACGRCNNPSIGLRLLLLYLTEKQSEAIDSTEHNATADTGCRHRLHVSARTTCPSTPFHSRA